MSYGIVGIDVADVAECHGHNRAGRWTGVSCAQCNGYHDHDWRIFRVVCGCSDPDHQGHVEFVLRCGICGGRACAHIGDVPRCRLRRHHVEPHEFDDGSMEPVGGYC